MLIYWQNHKLRLKQTLTVFHEDVNHALFKTVFDDVLVGLHHVGAEDVLVAAFSHVGSGRSSVCFQQVGAASLRGKHKASQRLPKWSPGFKQSNDSAFCPAEHSVHMQVFLR